MDIRIDIPGEKFKVRACGIIKHEDKYLIVRMGHNSFFCCPGGHIELGEDSATAVVREMFEESGIKNVIESPLAVMENFYLAKDQTKYHEISFYYLLKPTSLEGKDGDFELIENDKGYLVKQEFKWVTREQLKDIDFRPKNIKDKLVNNNLDFEVIINKDI